MPYKDIEKHREAIRRWRAEHPDRVKAHRRTFMVKKAIELKKFPMLSTLKAHDLTKEEVLQLVLMVYNNSN